MTLHERRRSLLWTACCVPRALLSQLRSFMRLAQHDEHGAVYCTALATRERLYRQLVDIEAELWRLDPDWSREAVALHSPLAKLKKEIGDDDTPENPHTGA
jgi:hypothetical protein